MPTLRQECLHVTRPYLYILIPTIFCFRKNKHQVTHEKLQIIVRKTHVTQWDYVNNCPTRCNTRQSIHYFASSLYMFRGVNHTHHQEYIKRLTTVSGNGHNFAQLPPSNVA